MKKRTAAKVNATKAVEVKPVAKVEETKAVAAPVVEEKKEEVKPVAEEPKKVVEEAKAEEKKPVAKKAPAKKAPAKKVVDEMKPEVYIQYQDKEGVVEEAIEKAKAAYVEDGHRVSSIKSLKVYLKPEEYAAYYVINEKFAGRVDLF